MKSKIYKLMGAVLVVVLLGSLTVGLVAPAGADPGTLKWTKLSMPQVEDWSNWDGFVESEGDFWATPGIDLGPIAISPDGRTLFAAVADGFYLDSEWFEVLKSTDGGYSWVVTGFWDDALADYDPIVDIVVSPDYADDTSVFVATMDYVYQSVDGGKNFVCMDDTPPWTGMIRDLDVTLDDRGRLAYMIGTWDFAGTGDVWVLATDTGLAWQEQDIGEDVLACAFTPGFADDEGICAVATDGSATWMSFSFAYVGEDLPGLGWGVDIADAPITDAWGDPFGSEHARIGFPDDFDPWGIGSNVCFVGIATYGFDADIGEWCGIGESLAYNGDVYKIVLKESGTSSAIDLDVRGVITTLLPTATEIASIDVSGDAEDATILVGTDTCNLTDTPASFFVYYSTDGGETWMPSFKAPTGGSDDPFLGGIPDLAYIFAMTRVLMAPDFGDSGIAYASTWGFWTDAFQRTSDGGESWNQISLIDYGDGTNGYTVPAGSGWSATGYNADGTLHMVTQCDSFYDPTGAVWKKVGKNWERILSYATPGVTDTIEKVDVLMGGETIFATDFVEGLIWRSSNSGATFPKKITTKALPTAVWFVSATTIYTATEDGNIWWSTKSGVGWTKPEESEIPPNTYIPALATDFMNPDLVIVSTASGMVFISSDGGETVEKIGINNPGANIGFPFFEAAAGTFDLNFATNNMVYATVTNPIIPFADGGVWRTEVDLDEPGDALWERIDDIQDDDPYDYATVIPMIPALSLPPVGVLCATDAATVVTGDVAGGMWRCANPTADIDGPAPPYFEKENKGLDAGVELTGLAIDLFPRVSFAGDTSAVNDYWEQIWMYTDTLDSGAVQTDPDKDATGVGLLPAGKVYPKVGLAWQNKPGATSYQYQLAYDTNFASMVESGYTGSLVSPAFELLPNKSYYWRARVANDDAGGNLIGAPLISPWSETWKFKTAIGASMARPDLEAPWAGQSNVDLSPTFEWSGIEWAEVYEYELGLDPTTGADGYFTAALKSLTGANALVNTAWKCDLTLEYEARYYWHVKAIGVDTETPWSDTGTFTTMGVAPTPPEPTPPVVIPPAEQITPAWIWAIVIIGAILVIAVIVLIVTTRRVP